MNRKLDEKLVKAFPNLYGDRHADMRSTAMCWGFDCSSGWFPLIWDLSKKLEAIISAMPEEKRQYYRASQVKEKFGTLRFYMSGETEEMSALIRVAENISAITCEDCGMPGKSNDRGWVRTNCDKCRDSDQGLGSKPIGLDWRIKLKLVFKHGWLPTTKE